MTGFNPKNKYSEGDIIGEWKLISEIEPKKKTGGWERWGVFVCPVCSKDTLRRFSGIQKVKSCGCISGELKSLHNLKHGLARRKKEHKYIHTIKGAIYRCTNKNCKDYERYGGRGITIYKEWLDDNNKFAIWLEENLPERKKGESLDRINNNGNYEPGNIRWANQKEQCCNRRGNLVVHIGKNTMICSDLSRENSIGQSTISYRYYNMGLRGNDLLKNWKSKKYYVNGESLTIKEISDKYSINYGTVFSRIKLGKQGNDIIKSIVIPNTYNIFGNKITIKEISNKYLIPLSTIQLRVSKGLLNEKVITLYKKAQLRA